MEGYSVESVIVGLLYILVFIAGIFSVSKTVDDSDYLKMSASRSHRIYRAASFQFFMAVIYVAVAIVMYPILMEYNMQLAFGFLILRVLAASFAVFGAVLLLLIVKASRDFLSASNIETARYSALGDQLKRMRDLVNHAGMIIPLCLGSIALYAVLFQSELIPSWISTWGIIGAIAAVCASVLVMTRQLKIIGAPYLLLNVPIAVQEIAFGIWLIFNGLKIPS